MSNSPQTSNPGHEPPSSEGKLFPPGFDSLLSWGRYLYWADLSRRQFEDFLATESAGPDGNTPLWLGVCGEYLARLWVVIEGWRKLQLADPEVEKILEARPDLLDVLRRFRHGMYHFQESVTDPRFVDLLQKVDHVHWTHLLHEAFCTYLWNHLNPTIGTLQQRREIRECLEGIMGWLPDEHPAAQLVLMKEKVAEVLDRDSNSPTAKDLLDALANGVRVAAEADEGLRRLRDDWFKTIVRDPK